MLWQKWRNARRPQAETCDYIHAHDDVIQSVYEEMPEEEVLYDLAELFKVFGDSTRIKILYVLFQSEMCVCDIAQLLNTSSVGYFPSASGFEAGSAGQIPPGRQNHFLFSG